MFIIVVCLFESKTIPSFFLIGCCVSELLCSCISNAWSEAVYCYLTRATLFTDCLHVFMIRVRGFYHFTECCCSTLSGF